MNTKRSALALLLTLGAALLTLTAAFWLTPTAEYSESERRALADFPPLSAETLLSGKFMDEFEKYAQDQFPLRDGFRRLKALAELRLFRQSDNNGYYQADGHISRLEYPLQEGMLDYAAQRIDAIYQQYLAQTEAKLYLAIAPDKNCYLAAENGYPAMDYDALARLLREGVPQASYIDLLPLLSADDYYRTDTHWRQERLLGVAQALADAMGADIDAVYAENTLDAPFYGVYAGQSALSPQPETLHYLTGEALQSAHAARYRDGAWETMPVYDLEKGRGRDGYDLFLSGAEALITLENPLAETDRELILFRDSFGSSLAPLLLSGYAKITLVDIRYVSSGALGELVDFDSADDVLFLYSSLTLNAASALR